MHSDPKLQRSLKKLLATSALVFATGACAQVAVSDAWVRGTVPGQDSSGAYMRLSAGSDAALVGVATPAAKIAEIHEMKMQGGVMHMHAVSKIALPAGKQIELEPGGYHVMLMRLTRPLKEGEAVPLTLTLEDGSGRRTTVEVKATVRPLTAASVPPKPPGH